MPEYEKLRLITIVSHNHIMMTNVSITNCVFLQCIIFTLAFLWSFSHKADRADGKCDRHKDGPQSLFCIALRNI